MKILSKVQILLLLLSVNLFLLSVILFFTFRSSQNTVKALPDNSKNVRLSLAANLADLNVLSKAYIIYDPAARVIVAGKNQFLRFSPASTAKIMAATIALENYPQEKILTANNMNKVEGSKMNLVEGERIRVIDLLYGMMLPSGNDAAFTIAENFDGGVNNFVYLMNKKAKDLNMDNTKFFDSDGYDDKNYTTAFDLARLGAYAMQNPTFSKIVDTRSKIVTDESGEIEHRLNNLNELLNIPEVNGIKTGFTNEAGGVLVTSIKHINKNYIIVVLNTPDRFGDTENLIRSAVQKLKLVTY